MTVPNSIFPWLAGQLRAPIVLSLFQASPLARRAYDNYQNHGGDYVVCTHGSAPSRSVALP